jgi:glycosyltransferase involved in cell wall biosynthesis
MEMEQINLNTLINLVLLYCPIRNGHYGLGSHIGHVVSFLKIQRGIRLTIIKTDDRNSEEIHSSIIDGIQTISLPTPEHKIALSSQDNLIQKRYATRIAEILDFHLQDKRNLLFWVNSIDYLNVCYSLKELFEDCKIMYVHHAWSWKCYINISDEKFTKKWRDNLVDHPTAVELSIFQQNLAQISDLVITVSGQAKHFFQETFDIPEGKVKIIYNGMPIPEEQTSGREKLRIKYGYLNNEKIILFAGRLKEEKGLAYLLGAFKLLAAEREDLRLIIIGDGDFDDFISLANPHWNKITYTGQIEPEQLEEFYTISDVGVLPSLFEQCSYTAIEMRFHKLPMIVSSVDGLEEMFEDKVDALKLKVYEDQNGYRILRESELAECIEELLDNPLLCKYLTKNSYEKAVKKFTKLEMCEKYYDEIQSLFNPI